MSVKGGLTPPGTRPRGRGPGKVAPPKRPGRGRNALWYLDTGVWATREQRAQRKTGAP